MNYKKCWVFIVFFCLSSHDVFSSTVSGSAIIEAQKRLNKEKKLNETLKTSQQKLMEFQSDRQKYLNFLKKQNASLKQKLSVMAPPAKGMSIEEQLKRARSQNSALKKMFEDVTRQKLQTPGTVVSIPSANTSNPLSVVDEGNPISPLLWKAAQQRKISALSSENEGSIARKADFASQKRTLSASLDAEGQIIKPSDFRLGKKRVVTSIAEPEATKNDFLTSKQMSRTIKKG